MASTQLHETPAPKIPEHLSKSKEPKTPEEKIDRQMKDSFPASDPPSYCGRQPRHRRPGEPRKRIPESRYA